jgi:hypothetical protein
MSKTNPDNKTRTTFHPRFSPETQAVRSYLATNATTPDHPRAGKTGLTASVKRHIWGPLTTVNGFLQFCFKFSPKAPETRGF